AALMSMPKLPKVSVLPTGISGPRDGLVTRMPCQLVSAPRTAELLLKPACHAATSSLSGTMPPVQDPARFNAVVLLALLIVSACTPDPKPINALTLAAATAARIICPLLCLLCDISNLQEERNWTLAGHLVL